MMASSPEADEALEPLNPDKAPSTGMGAEEEATADPLSDPPPSQSPAGSPDNEQASASPSPPPYSPPAATTSAPASRFEVEKVVVEELGRSGDGGDGSALKPPNPRFAVDVIEMEEQPSAPPVSGHNITIRVTDTSKANGDNSAGARDNLPLADHEESAYDNHMALYEDDLYHGRISTILNRINTYQGGVQPSITDVDKAASQRGTLGTLLGVYLPCIQNIFGVLLFVRMTWIVGSAGCIESFFIVLICCTTTLLTSISMSAIATNGVVPAGGSYFMISRALGPEFGGAVGVLFYLGTSVASSMYIIGAVEILVVYMAPDLDRFGDTTNSFRLYGTVMLILLCIIVLIGVAFVSRFATVSLACVILSILCIYIGIFVANPDRSVEVCLLGDRLLTLDSVTENGTMMCTKNDTGPIYHHYCALVNSSTGEYKCDDYFDTHKTSLLKGIPGLGSGIFVNNTMSRYSEENDVIGTDMEGNSSRGEIISDITTSFMVLLAIYFPSCTGIMAGSNRSGDLADAQKSIPIGTICAIITTSFVYLTSVLFFSGAIEGDVMRDKYGESIGGSLLIGKLAWPHEWVILIGSFLSTMGAGLQSLTGAPRLLQAIAQDGVIPFLGAFSVTTKKGEPFRALLLTAFISFIGVSIGNLDYVAPIITMFFLMCYGFVNMACALQTLLRTPNWRPRFRFYHWVLSLIGLALCITLMFISSWYYALAAIAIAGCIYKYIEYKGAEQEWGDGIRGLAMSAARYSLLRLQEGPPHTKNWRPQLLVLMKCDSQLQPKYPKMVQFASQLKAGKGLTLVYSVLEGKFSDRYADAQAAKQTLSKLIKELNVKGFSDVSVATNVMEGICSLVQNAGLGGLRHNTVVMGWPYGWRHSDDERSYKVFLETVRNVSAAGLALLVTKGINQFPEPDVKLKGTIDVWWIVHDGGLLMLLPFLLTREKPWKHCKLRIFTVAQMEDNSITMKKDLEMYLYQLRIAAEVDVIEMNKQDISAYTYERTLMMEQRTDMLRSMRLSKPQVQSIVDRNHPAHQPGDNAQNSPQRTHLHLDTVPEESTTDHHLQGGAVSPEQFTFTPAAGKQFKEIKEVNKVDPNNVRRMHTAVRLNENIVEKSHDAQLVILNLPAPPKSSSGDENYMEYLEVLTEGIDRVLMVRGSGREVITIYS